MLCKKALLYIISSVLCWSCFVVVGKGALEVLPPISVLAIQSLLASFFALCFCAIKKINLLPTGAWRYVFASGAINVVVFHGLVLFALQNASSSLVAILCTLEVFSTFVFFNIFAGVKVTKKQIIGALTIMLASAFVVGENIMKHEMGTEYFAIIAAFFAPLGNFFQKKSVSIIHPATHLMWRSIIGGAALVIAAVVFESENTGLDTIMAVWPYLLAGGVFAMFLSKMLLLETFKLADVPFVIAIANTSPAATMVLAFILLGEVPTLIQVFGFFLMLAGAKFVLIKN